MPGSRKVGIIVGFPLRQQLLSVVDIDLFFGYAERHQPLLHGDAIILTQTIGNPSGLGISPGSAV
jgi:chemotaxis signal transduction protein